MFGIVNIIITLVILVGVLILHIFLSRMKSPIPGLILPLLSFLPATAFPFLMTQNSGGFGSLLLTWVLANIPTLILLAIYFCCRPKKAEDPITKMNIQDL